MGKNELFNSGTETSSYRAERKLRINFCLNHRTIHMHKDQENT